MGFRGNHKNKRDLNEADIFDILRDAGIQVHPLDTPCDAVCNYMNVNYLVEVKNGPKAPFTTAQIKFHKEWKGQIVTLCTEQEARDWVRAVKLASGHEFRGVIS